jgi:hypothetical protein
MADLYYTFFVARYVGDQGGAAFSRPIRTLAAHPIAAAERALGTRLYLVGDPRNIHAEVSYIDLGGQEERLFLYRAPLDCAPVDPSTLRHTSRD